MKSIKKFGKLKQINWDRKREIINKGKFIKYTPKYNKKFLTHVSKIVTLKKN